MANNAKVDKVNNHDKNTIMLFMENMQLFQFAPPSDTLWTVSIDTADIMTKEIHDISTHLGTLYNAIIETNKKWTNKTASKWKVRVDKLKVNELFFEKFAALPEIFIATDISFTPIENNINRTVFSNGQQFGSFYNFGHVAMSRPNNRNLNISFLVSNWDIGDILFEPWIAAVAQKGLIEDDSSTIKANITIKEYTAYDASYTTATTKRPQMQCRKQYRFFNCVPTKRSEIQKNYEPNEAGAFKKSIVSFVFDDYEIDYMK